jgi:hypothetical protein
LDLVKGSKKRKARGVDLEEAAVGERNPCLPLHPLRAPSFRAPKDDNEVRRLQLSFKPLLPSLAKVDLAIDPHGTTELFEPFAECLGTRPV